MLCIDRLNVDLKLLHLLEYENASNMIASVHLALLRVLCLPGKISILLLAWSYCFFVLLPVMFAGFKKFGQGVRQ
jgi:hypothetical protein